MNIRIANSKDMTGLESLMMAFNAGEGIPWRPDAVTAAFAQLCAEPSLGFALVSEEQSTLGYIVVTYNYDLEFAGRDAFVTEFYVARDVRRRGIGTALLTAAEAEARRHDVRALHLLVAPGNHVAETLYRSAGFVASPRILMTKALADCGQ